MRNGTFEAIELLLTFDVARYRDAPGSNLPDFEFGAPDNGFTTAGTFRTVTAGYDSNAAFLSVNGTRPQNPYAGAGVVTPALTRIQLANSVAFPGELDVTLTPAVTLNPPGGGSATRRVFLVSGPVTYLCNEAAGTLTRYSGYGISAVQPSTPAALAGPGVVVTAISNNLTTCNFSVNAGTATRGDVAGLTLTFAQAGEQIVAMHQSHTEYVP